MRKVQALLAGAIIRARYSFRDQIHPQFKCFKIRRDQILIVFDDIATAECKFVGDAGKRFIRNPAGLDCGRQ